MKINLGLAAPVAVQEKYARRFTGNILVMRRASDCAGMSPGGALGRNSPAAGLSFASFSMIVAIVASHRDLMVAGA
jgi:hypothetical protein